MYSLYYGARLGTAFNHSGPVSALHGPEWAIDLHAMPLPVPGEADEESVRLKLDTIPILPSRTTFRRISVAPPIDEQDIKDDMTSRQLAFLFSL
jgi:hypothetical protein